jgi:putative SOS response-associated peptidase YedK
VITGDAKGPLIELHDRMPLIVPVAGYAKWLDPRATDLAIFSFRPPSVLWPIQ